MEIKRKRYLNKLISFMWDGQVFKKRGSNDFRLSASFLLQFFIASLFSMPYSSDSAGIL